MQTYAYGPHAAQTGDLHLPVARPALVVCLLHGGFWRMPHGRGQLTAIATDLAGRGHAAWNLGYRRLDEPGGGWPGTFDDVLAGIDHLATLADQGIALPLDRIVVAGHSAGGHLALWAVQADPMGDRRPRRVRPAAGIGLAAVADLALAHALGLGNGAADELLGGSPAACSDRYRIASPIERPPPCVPQLILHGMQDTTVPVAMSRGYARHARAGGAEVRLVELAQAGHMDFVDPASDAHAALCEGLDGMANSAPS